MKKKLLILVCIFVMAITSACEKKEYNGKYVHWGDIRSGLSIEKLKRNNIPYKLKANQVFIPEDAFDYALYCCS
ncbi:hypothetical protein [Neobacillus endophyticus]|uniref:hypothetical protein n=1 Tax=Neobacillus endophyticus TaxID=2738405 RepID=UPI001FE980F1|nr:hypothetical protein [Neobacillus endophyticus]